MQTPEGAREGLFLDYVRFTLPDEVGLEGSYQLLGAEDWVAQERGALGYGSMLRRGHQQIYHEGRPGMGVHVELSGQGCREMEARPGFRWPVFLKAVLALGGKFTRVDAAWDDRSGRLDLDELMAKTNQREWVSRWRTWDTNNGGIIRQGQVRRQRKVTFGRRGSDAYLRIYDKAAEQVQEGHWVRVELELRDERATHAVGAFLAHGAAYLAGVLRGYLSFVEPETATRRERAQDWEPWVAFLDFAEKCQLCVAPAERTLHKVKDWLQRQVAPAMALVFEAGDNGAEELMRIVMDGKQRLKGWHREVLKQEERAAQHRRQALLLAGVPA